jgi:hypothetical protein
MNPPYGERISPDDIMGLYGMIGERLKHVFPGYEAWILSYRDECFDKIGLRPKHKIKLRNGDLQCEYRCYELFEGSNKDFKRNSEENGGGKPAGGKRPYKEGTASEPRKRYAAADASAGRAAGPEKEPGDERSERYYILRDRRRGIEEGWIKRREDKRGERRFPDGKDTFARRKRDGDDKPFRPKARDFDKAGRSAGKPFDKARKFIGDKDRKPFDKERISAGKPFDKARRFAGDKDRKPFKKSDGRRDGFGNGGRRDGRNTRSDFRRGK